MASILIYLQPSPVPLCDRTAQTESVKNHLRREFLALARRWHSHIIARGYLAEPFDPKHGTPLYSDAGDWPLDDVAVAHALLSLPIMEQGGCHLLCHPQWQTAVFPATLLSSATPKQLRKIIKAGNYKITAANGL
ncbi:MAG: methylmalonic aciduria and homocystinuria type D protein [Cyanobacteria bacterium P01_F01_bin.42]